MEPKFKIGDIVKHKVSGEEGIVTHVSMGCTVHSAHFVCESLPPDTRQCQVGFRGEYQVEYGFAKKALVRESHIEKACDSEQATPLTTSDVHFIIKEEIQKFYDGLIDQVRKGVIRT